MGFFNRSKKQKEEETLPANKPMQTEEMIETSQSGISAVTDMIMADMETDIERERAFVLPIGELSSLGAAAASLLPAFRTITQTTAVDTSGLFRLANATVGDTLKVAKDGNFWGAFKTAGGGSKFAKLTQAGPLNATSTTVIPIDPATIMVAAALYSIEHKLDAIAETQKQILVFLETEKESQIEADVKTLAGTFREFKFNWDKEVFINGHYKQALDVKRTAEKNLQSYQKELQDIRVKAPIAANANISAAIKSMLKKFRYYRMSLYLYSMSSFLEVALLGDFREEHILKVKEDIEERSMRYRQIYAACSAYVEKVAKNGLEANVIKGIGNAGKAIGGFIGSIPLVKEGPVDEWLIGGGDVLKKNAKGMENDAVQALSAVSNPETGVFTEKMDMLNRICNHTSKICFDKEKIYLIAG